MKIPNLYGVTDHRGDEFDVECNGAPVANKAGIALKFRYKEEAHAIASALQFAYDSGYCHGRDHEKTVAKRRGFPIKFLKSLIP